MNPYDEFTNNTGDGIFLKVAVSRHMAARALFRRLVRDFGSAFRQTAQLPSNQSVVERLHELAAKYKHTGAKAAPFIKKYKRGIPSNDPKIRHFGEGVKKKAIKYQDPDLHHKQLMNKLKSIGLWSAGGLGLGYGVSKFQEHRKREAAKPPYSYM